MQNDIFIRLKQMKLQRINMMLLALLALSLNACTAVAPWERGTLAKASMSMEPHPLHALLRDHNYSSREAAVGGHSSGGGGCGCY